MHMQRHSRILFKAKHSMYQESLRKFYVYGVITFQWALNVLLSLSQYIVPGITFTVEGTKKMFVLVFQSFHTSINFNVFLYLQTCTRSFVLSTQNKSYAYSKWKYCLAIRVKSTKWICIYVEYYLYNVNIV